MNGFITGSHAYGAPTEESDVDLVLFLDPTASKLLNDLSETRKIPVRYGDLNLILCHSEAEYLAWKGFTDDMVAKKISTGVPVSSDEARIEFDKRRVPGGYDPKPAASTAPYKGPYSIR